MNNKTIFLSLLIIGVLLKIIFILSNTSLWWDSSVYIGMAKIISSNGESGLWEPLRPLVWPLILSFLMLLKVNHVFFGNVFQLFFSLGSVWLTYKIGKKIFGLSQARIACLLLLFTPTIFFYERLLLTEIPAIFFGTLALYFFVEKKYFLTGLVAGISFLTKFPLGLLFAGLIVASFGENKRMLKIFAGFLIPALIFLVLNFYLYSNIFTPLIDGMEVFEKSSWFYKEGVAYYVFELFKENVFFLFCVLGLFFIKKREHLALSLCFLLPFLYFGYITHKEVRFYLLFLPFISLLGAKGISSFAKYKFSKLVFIFLFLIFLTSSGSRFLNYYAFNNPLDFNYYNLVNDFSSKDKILVSDPRFVLFTDKKLIPLYYKNYDQNSVDNKLKTANFAIVNSCDMLCEPKSQCEIVQKNMYEVFMKEFELTKDLKINDCIVRVYEKKKI